MIIFVFICFIFIEKYKIIKKHNDIINRFKKLKNKEYKIVCEPILLSTNKKKKNINKNNKKTFKMIYEIDFDCSVCLVKLKKYYDLYLKLLKICKVDFIIITSENSISYIKFYLDRTLKNYDIYIVNQKFIIDGADLYLLDRSNKIIMAGDIKKYPFLRKEYIRRLKKHCLN